MSLTFHNSGIESDSPSAKNAKVLVKTIDYENIVAEREGFEPSIGFHLYTLSRRAP